MFKIGGKLMKRGSYLDAFLFNFFYTYYVVLCVDK